MIASQGNKRMEVCMKRRFVLHGQLTSPASFPRCNASPRVADDAVDLVTRQQCQAAESGFARSLILPRDGLEMIILAVL